MTDESSKGQCELEPKKPWRNCTQQSSRLSPFARLEASWKLEEKQMRAMPCFQENTSSKRNPFESPALSSLEHVKLL